MWKSWKKKTWAAICSAGLQDILDSADEAEKNPVYNETVFDILHVATADGNSSHIVNATEEEKHGHSAYRGLVDWYEGDSLTTETAEDVSLKLDNMNIYTRTTASEYINYFKLYTKQLI